MKKLPSVKFPYKKHLNLYVKGSNGQKLTGIKTTYSKKVWMKDFGHNLKATGNNGKNQTANEISMNMVKKIADMKAEELYQHIEEFACAFIKKHGCDPRKVVMIQHNDYANGKTIIWFEKKRGRSAKEILNNVLNK